MATSTVDSSNDGSDEQQRDNYIKYYCLLSEVATETLRNLFQKEIKMHDLRAYFEREPRVLRGLFESQRAILNAQPLPDISQFDISLMAVLFRNRAIFPRLQHYASGPDSLMAQIQILSSIRNDIAHIGDRVHIPTSEFKRHWDELVYVILKIAIDVGQESTAKATKGIAKLEHKTWATEEQQSILHRIKYDQSHIITEITELSTRLANLDSSLENMRMQQVDVQQSVQRSEARTTRQFEDTNRQLEVTNQELEVTNQQLEESNQQLEESNQLLVQLQEQQENVQDAVQRSEVKTNRKFDETNRQLEDTHRQLGKLQEKQEETQTQTNRELMRIQQEVSEIAGIVSSNFNILSSMHRQSPNTFQRMLEMVQGEIRSIQPYLNAMAKEIGTEKKNVTQYNQIISTVQPGGNVSLSQCPQYINVQDGTETSYFNRINRQGVEALPPARSNEMVEASSTNVDNADTLSGEVAHASANCPDKAYKSSRSDETEKPDKS